MKSLWLPCHRSEDKPAPRKTKIAPDLVWADNRYQQEWVVAWLQKLEFTHDPVDDDVRPERTMPHLSMSVDQATVVTQFLATRNDSRMSGGAP